jgi:hypothetical protein
MDTNEERDSNQFGQGAHGPLSTERLKEYGIKAYVPLLKVVTKYQDEFTLYLSALSKGLRGGAEVLSQQGASDEERFVSSFFKEAVSGLDQATEKISGKDPHALSAYLSDFAARKPSLMFSTSYLAGIFIGRLGRHLVTKAKDHPEKVQKKKHSSYENTQLTGHTDYSPGIKGTGQPIH